MLVKVFKVTLVLFVSVFTMCAIVMLLAAVFTFLSVPYSGGIATTAGGVSFFVVRIVAAAVVFVVALAIWRLARRSQ